MESVNPKSRGPQSEQELIGIWSIRCVRGRSTYILGLITDRFPRSQSPRLFGCRGEVEQGNSVPSSVPVVASSLIPNVFTPEPGTNRALTTSTSSTPSLHQTGVSFLHRSSTRITRRTRDGRDISACISLLFLFSPSNIGLTRTWNPRLHHKD